MNLTILLYADDVVLISDNCKNLQTMLDIVSEYAYKWRFELNKKKSQVVIFGTKRKKGKWKLAGGELKTVNQYKYLGIEFTSTDHTSTENRRKPEGTWSKAGLWGYLEDIPQWNWEQTYGEAW